MHVRRAVAVLCLLVALPAAAASIALSTPSFTASDATLEGSPGVVDYRSADGIGTAQLRVLATSLVVETDAARYVVEAGGGLSQSEPTTKRVDYRGGQVIASVVAGQTGLFVVPDGPLALELDALKMAATVPMGTCLQQPEYFTRDREFPCLDVTGTALFTSERRGSMVLNGSFTMFLWGWEGSIDGPDRSDRFWSGTRYENPADLMVGPSELRHVILHVQGELELFAASSASPDLYMASARVDARQARIETPLGPSVVSDGTIDVSRLGGELRATVVTGTVTAPDGTVVQAAGEEAGPDWWLLAAVGMILAAAPATLAGRRWRARTWLRRARESVVLGNFHAAARQAETAMRHRSTRVPAGIVGAIALIRVGDTDDARLFIDQLQGAEPAAVSYLNACLAAKAGRRQEARRWLADCLAKNPAYENEARANPLLAGIVVAPGAAPGQESGAYA